MRVSINLCFVVNFENVCSMKCEYSNILQLMNEICHYLDSIKTLLVNRDDLVKTEFTISGKCISLVLSVHQCTGKHTSRMPYNYPIQPCNIAVKVSLGKVCLQCTL